MLTEAFPWVDSAHLCKQSFPSLKLIASGDTIIQNTIYCRETCSNMWIVAWNTPWNTYRVLTMHVCEMHLQVKCACNTVFCVCAPLSVPLDVSCLAPAKMSAKHKICNSTRNLLVFQFVWYRSGKKWEPNYSSLPSVLVDKWRNFAVQPWL